MYLVKIQQTIYEDLYYYYRYSALGPVWAETRAQSGYWYVSGTLHPGQILRGSLSLLSPAFRSSHFRYQVPPRPPRRERSQRRKVELVGENWQVCGLYCWQWRKIGLFEPKVIRLLGQPWAEWFVVEQHKFSISIIFIVTYYWNCCV